jgi:hypothetical protein
MRYYDRHISSECRDDYFDYEYNKDNEIEVTHYYIESEYGYYSLVRYFLNKHGYELSPKTLIEHKNIFTKSSECIDVMQKLILSKKLNIELIKAYLSHIDIIKYINETKTKDERIYELLATNKVCGQFYHLKIEDIEIFDKYLKEVFKSKVAKWSRWDYSWFVRDNRQLTYINFYRKYLDIFDIKILLFEKLNVPSKIVEDFITKKYIAKEVLGDNEYDDRDYDFRTMARDYSNKLSTDFIKNNIDVLGGLINWHEAKLNIDTLMELEESIKHEVVNCYTNKENIFPVNKTIEYIKKYLNIEEFIKCTEINIGETACKEYDHYNYNELIRRIEVFIKYMYLNKDNKYSLKLMLEVVHTCTALIDEYKKLMENGVSIKEAQISIKNAYAGKIEELVSLFNDIKESI